MLRRKQTGFRFRFPEAGSTGIAEKLQQESEAPHGLIAA